MAKVTERCCRCGKTISSYNDPSVPSDITSDTYCANCYDKLQKEIDAYRGGKR